MDSEKTFTISEISSGIKHAVEAAFPESIWVVGEIQGLDRSRHGKHWYFQLCETDEAGEVSRLAATLWKGVRDRLFGPSGKLKGIIDMEEPLDGIKIRALCRLDFYAPYGKISLHVQDIDPAYTLGDLEARRQALIEQLTKEGVLHRNRSLAMTEVPLRVGLITSEGSAAYNDFIKELEKSGLSFQIQVCDARMQGEESIPTIRSAFSALQRLKPDAIALIRGGGSRLDLSWFDREEVVRCIIGCPLPVITGIGHEIDVTVCELAAHQGMKTPTAAAAFLADRVRAYHDAVVELTRGVARAAVHRADREIWKLQSTVGGLVGAFQMVLVEEAGFHHDTPRRLASAAKLLLEREVSALAACPSRLASGPPLRRFENLRLDLSRLGLSLRHIWSRRHQGEDHRLALFAERLRLLDPVRTLQRGYALLKNEEGELIKSVNPLSRSDRFTAFLRDGRISARVEETERDDDDDEKEKRQLEIW